jgi:hypothetical protein
MAIIYKVLGHNNPAATTATTLYTVPAGTSAVVSSLNVCNQAATAGTFRIAIRPAGATLTTSHYLSYDTILPANDTVSLNIGMSLATTDVITVYASSANVSFILFGTELT